MSETTLVGHEGAPTTTEKDSEAQHEGLRVRGRTFLMAFYKALRSTTLYPREHSQVRESLDELDSCVSDILATDGELEVRVSHDLIFVNETLLRLDIENFASFGQVVRTCSQAGIGSLRVDDPPARKEWKALIIELLRFEPQIAKEQPFQQFQRVLLDRGVQNIDVGPQQAGNAEPQELTRKQAAKQTLQQSVSVTKSLFDSARLGQVPRLKDVTHAVQGIVDQVLNDEVTIMGLSTLKDYDDYTFTHTVNVCIFSVALGRRLGFTKPQLFDLGMAALLHDIGKSRVDVDVVEKEGDLSAEEATRLEAHTWLGAFTAFGLHEFGGVPFRGMITAYEHHMKMDFSGYPVGRRPRELSIFSKIVAVADAYDLATTSRGESGAKSPDVALRELREDSSCRYDPVLVKALVNLLGIYPVGTVVILDTFEVALVHAANPDETQIHRPIVRVIGDANGVWLDDPPFVDLARTQADGSYGRSIIKVADPDKYLINVSDYFV